MAFTLNQKIKTIFKLLSEPGILTALLSQRDFGYLKEIGWFESFKSNRSVNKERKPIPWFTYPFIDFLLPRIFNDLFVFEFGSGNSTLFFSEKTKRVISIEHNNAWYQIISKNKPENVEIVLTKTDSINDYLEYLNYIEDKVDLIVVDGLHRNECTIKACDKLSERGVIILDDSERPEYKEGIEFVLNKGFKRIDFWGIAPTILFKKCTTVFYKNNNCLEI